ncbi:MAG: DUF4924 family protein [Tannerella sp.]|jgi:hypothetical protein|nr:DUF4924 family protein [Tannerella sp.]
MLVAQQKRKENIVEYLLYMWQVEDLIRAGRFDLELLVGQYDQPEEVKKQIRQWYVELIEMMYNEGVMESGHIQLNQNIISSLTDYHIRLLKEPGETVYKALYYKTLPFIVQLRSKSGGVKVPELETCFIALYGYLLLRFQKKEIRSETIEAVKQINTFLSYLAEKYKDDTE